MEMLIIQYHVFLSDSITVQCYSSSTFFCKEYPREDLNFSLTLLSGSTQILIKYTKYTIPLFKIKQNVFSLFRSVF